MIGLIDTHTHLFCEEFDDDRELALIRAKQAGVSRMFMPNIDDTTTEALLGMCDKHKECYPLMGLHPTSVDSSWEERHAHNELMECMSPYRESQLRGIFHSFGGDIGEAENLLEFKNFMLGINGIVTFKKSSLPETLSRIPLERIVLETDSPYLAPVPHRGERNESAYVISIAEKLASIYKMPTEEIAQHTSVNALKVFLNAG